MKSVFVPEKRQTLTDKAISQLNNAIAMGKLQPGDRLVETELAESLDVGRNTVREALRTLEKEGIVTITPFKGARVSEADDLEVQQMFEVMSGLEAMSAGFAVQRMNAEDLKRIEDLHAELEIHFHNRDHDRYLEVNWAYHKFIQELAKNEVLNKLINGLRLKIQLYRRKQLYQPDRFEASMAEHRDILKAFRRKDPRMVEDAMKNHLLKQGESLMA